MTRMRMTGAAGLTALVLSAVLGLGGVARASSRTAAAQGMPPTLAAAVAHFEAGRYGEARAELAAALARTPEDALLYHWLSRTYLALGDDERAVTNAEAAVERAPQVTEYHRWLGRAYGDKADRTRSFWLARKVKSEFERAVELDPANIAAHRDLLEFYLDAPWIVGGGDGRARDEVRAIAALDPMQGELARATYFRSTGRTGQAAAAYGRVLARKPAVVDPYMEAADFYVRRGQLDGLDRAVAGAMQVAPSDRRLDFYRGVAAVLSGAGVDEAEGRLTAYLSAVPPDDDAPSAASAHLWLGRLYQQAGRTAEAIAQYERVLQLDPDRRAAQRALDHLRSVR